MRYLLSLAFISLASLINVSALQFHGADFSVTPLLESQGKTFSDNGVTKPFEQILASHGANIARIRIWTAGTYTQSYALSLAKRAKAAGMKVLLDLHYSDTWADPGKQAIPSSWPTDLSGLTTKIYSYTHDLVASFVSQGVPVDFIQIGNEINDGLLWPTGRISVSGFPATSQLLHSAASGVRAASASTKIVVHIANGWDSGGVSWFFNGVFITGALQPNDVDLFGFSFYPFYGTGATLAALKSSLTTNVQKYNKDVMVVETDWPASCTTSVALSEPNIPRSVAGQQQWVTSIETVLAGLPNARGLGVVYWEPGWVGSAALGSSCADNLLVDSNGKTRASISIFQT